MMRAVYKAWGGNQNSQEKKPFNIVLMHDRGLAPTRVALLQALEKWRAGGEKDRVFHFSGHGTQVVDTNGDESDGMDEAICPLDFETNGFITDDELRECLPLHGITLMVLDCCHSGSGVDLPFAYFGAGEERISGEADPYKRQRFVVAVSGCRDEQESDGNERGGFLTQALLRVTEQGAILRTIPLLTLLEKLHQELNMHCQKPQLSCNHRLHPDATLMVPQCVCCPQQISEV